MGTRQKKDIRIQIRNLLCSLGHVSFLFGFFLFRDQVLQNQNRNFFFETKFSETETFLRDQILRNQNRDFFFQDQHFLKPKPRHFFRDQIFQNRHFFLRLNSLKPKPKPSKNCQVSKPRSFEIEMSISAPRRNKSRENLPELLTT